MESAQLEVSAAKGGGVQGAQLIARTCNLLREIARFGSSGARLRDLTDVSALTHATVHRILQSLVVEGFVIRDPLNRRYRLGTGIFELGLAAPSPLAELSSVRPLLESLAKRIGDTVYLMMRRDDEIICLAHAEGESPLRAYVIEVGAVRPICASLGGICMLAVSDDEEIGRVMARTLDVSTRFGDVTPTYIRRQIAHVREHGYCISREVLLETATGISAVVPNANGAPFLAISLSAVTSRVPESRVRPLVKDLLDTCNGIAAVLDKIRSRSVSERTTGA